MKTPQQIAEEAFFLGFMASREGCNGECAFDHCAGGLSPALAEESDFRARMEQSPAFRQLREEAVRIATS